MNGLKCEFFNKCNFVESYKQDPEDKLAGLIESTCLDLKNPLCIKYDQFKYSKIFIRRMNWICKMAGLRKASAYSKKKVVPFTRISKKKQKSYIKTVPQQKIVKFTMGKESLLNDKKLPYKFTVFSKEKVQIRHNALEACRQYINKKLEKELGNQYVFKVVPFPHHIQRENKMLTGAGADRMQTGMQLAYGKSSGKAAILKPNSKIFFVAVPNKKAAIFLRKVLKQIKSKLPCKTRIIEEIKK